MAGWWWLTSVIITTWEAEIQRIKVGGHFRQKVHKTSSQQKKPGMVACICHLSYIKKHKIVGPWSRLAWAKKQDLISKVTKAKRAGGRTQAVKLLLSKYKALS
jgi:hypothetical protein